MNYADEIIPTMRFSKRGVKVIVDSASLPLIDGTVVDFVKQGLNEAFKFQNPKPRVSADAARASTSENRLKRL